MNPRNEERIMVRKVEYLSLKKHLHKTHPYQFKLYKGLTTRQKQIDKRREEFCMVKIEWGGRTIYHNFLCKETDWKRYFEIMEGKDVNFGDLGGNGERSGDLHKRDVKVSKVIDDSKIIKNVNFFEAMDSEISDLENEEDREFCFSFVEKYINNNPLEIGVEM